MDFCWLEARVREIRTSLVAEGKVLKYIVFLHTFAYPWSCRAVWYFLCAAGTCSSSSISKSLFSSLVPWFLHVVTKFLGWHWERQQRRQGFGGCCSLSMLQKYRKSRYKLLGHWHLLSAGVNYHCHLSNDIKKSIFL